LGIRGLSYLNRGCKLLISVERSLRLNRRQFSLVPHLLSWGIEENTSISRQLRRVIRRLGGPKHIVMVKLATLESISHALVTLLGL
jgi:hypothetical protein